MALFKDAFVNPAREFSFNWSVKMVKVGKMDKMVKMAKMAKMAKMQRA